MNIKIQENYINSKYHYAVAKRLFENYAKFSEKRLIVGVINELARATSNIIRAYLLLEKKKKLADFTGGIAQKYDFDGLTIDNLLKVLEIERAQKVSPVEFTKDESVILLVDGKYRFLTIARLGEFIVSCETAITKFSLFFRQI